MKRVLMASSMATALAGAGACALVAATPPACDPDNGGLKLPDGFCALVVADNIGAARHLAVDANGDVYVAMRALPGSSGGGVVALRDANGDGRMDATERFASGSSTGIGLRNGYLYVA